MIHRYFVDKNVCLFPIGKKVPGRVTAAVFTASIGMEVEAVKTFIQT